MNATQAFDCQLQQLSLNDFPSGNGPWREDYQYLSTRKARDLKLTKMNMNHYSSVTLKDYDANFERTESLSEYVSAKKSPWLMDYSWSGEAKALRELAVKSPWLINREFTRKHFRTLRILDKDVREIDPGLRLLVNLEELTLSANYIKSVNSENLPPKLRVLELCANCIENLDGLTNSPRPLEHLGIGKNCLTTIGSHISGDFWPNLLSLDLSNNNLCELVEIVASLATLPVLRCLVLNGNPLALIPGYRGFVTDSLRKLLILDDLRITSDEKHYFRGLARRKEHILEESVVVMHADNIKHLAVPEEIRNPGDFPEFPVIVRKYFVQFWYPEAIVLEPTPRDTVTEEAIEEVEKVDPKLKREVSSPSKEFVTKVKELEVLSREEHGIQLLPFRSEGAEYSPEGVEIHWSRKIVCDRLTELRDFFANVGFHFDIVEEKSLLYPPDELPAEEPKSHSAQKRAKKDDKGKATETPKKDDKGKKKKPVDRASMVTYSTTMTLLASFWTSSHAFTEGETLVKTTLSTEGPVATPPPSPTPQEDPKGKKKDDKKGGKDKGAKGGKGKKEDTLIEESDVPPPPLQVKVSFEMESWKSAKDCPVKAEGV